MMGLDLRGEERLFDFSLGREGSGGDNGMM